MMKKKIKKNKRKIKNNPDLRPTIYPLEFAFMPALNPKIRNPIIK